MAIKYKCDRCGKEFGCWSVKKMVRFPVGILWEYSRRDCVKELNKFMSGAKLVE